MEAAAESESIEAATTLLSGTAARPYEVPEWARGILSREPMHGRLTLANLPTPLHLVMDNTKGQTNRPLQQHKPHQEDDDTATSPLQALRQAGVATLVVKRDDMSGGPELGGNKVRKLEFLLADALAREYTDVVTIGGEQSNHCRATAAACRMCGLKPHLILRSKRANDVADFGYTGNILLDRMVGSHIYTCTPGEYGRVGSDAMVERLCTTLEKSSGDTKRRVYPIPVGGSNWLGTWGYIEGVRETLAQWKLAFAGEPLDHVVFACGSGGTATGICLGMALAHGASLDGEGGSYQGPTIHAVGVCDDPDYFYEYVAGIAVGMGLYQNVKDRTASLAAAQAFARRHMILYQGKGLGYAQSTAAELEFVNRLSCETGVVLDPVYSGKALHHFLTQVVPQQPSSFDKANVLFWHTGGALGLYDKVGELSPMIETTSPVRRLDVYGNAQKSKASSSSSSGSSLGAEDYVSI